jgi:hypothetical protein
MTIHPVRTSGLILGVSQAFDYLEKMQDRIINYVITHSKIKEGLLPMRQPLLKNKEGTL